MQPKGYKTSSSTISRIIQSEGLEAFNVIKIVTEFEGKEPLEYETDFLVENNCAGSKEWYNHHNNTGIGFGTEEFSNMMVEKFGVTNISFHPEFSDLLKQVNLRKRGVDSHNKCPGVKAAKVATSLQNYGVEHHITAPEVKAKSIATINSIYGVDNVFANEQIKEQIRQTNLERYGLEYAANSKEIQEKVKQTNLERYGVDSPFKSEEIQEKCKDTLEEKYGVRHSGQTENSRKVASAYMTETNNKLLTCPHCGIKVNLGNLNRWHGDKCKKKPQ